MIADDQGTIVAPAVRDFGLLETQLVTWLGQRLPGARQLRVRGPSYPRGAGQSHETILFDLTWTERGSPRNRGLVVRIKPTTFTVFRDDLFAQEYRVMQVLGEVGAVPVAPVLWFEDDASALGSPFFVMERLNGRVAVSHPSYLDEGWVADASTHDRERLWHHCVQALARLSAVPVDRVDFLRSETGESGFDREWRRWEEYLAFLDRPDRPLPVHREMLGRLRSCAPADRPDGLVWGDARLGNMMIGADLGVVALMDWEQPSLGGPLQDLGWWLFNQHLKVLAHDGVPLSGMLDRAGTLRVWEQASGLSCAGIDWYEAFAGLKMACLMLNLLDLRGQQPPGGDPARMVHVRETLAMLGRLG